MNRNAQKPADKVSKLLNSKLNHSVDAYLSLYSIPGEFQCSHRKMCIPKSQVCDGKSQCRDHSDELGCWEQTRSCEHRCKDSRRCIPNKFLCDGERDCVDGTDEMDCGRLSQIVFHNRFIIHFLRSEHLCVYCTVKEEKPQPSLHYHLPRSCSCYKDRTSCRHVHSSLHHSFSSLPTVITVHFSKSAL